MTIDEIPRQVRLSITPERPAVDTELHVQVCGLPPGGTVTIRAQSHDASGQAWHSHAAFLADSAGTVDLSRDAPLSGCYLSADAMGLVWSMEPAGQRDPAQARDRLGPPPPAGWRAHPSRAF